MRMISFLVAACVAAAASAQVQQSPPAGSNIAPEASQPLQADMHSSMRQMHEQMAKIKETRDPVERERLMREHMSTMHHGMMMMGRMMGASPDGAGNPCVETDMQCRMAQLQRQQGMMAERMGMMHEMMQQMMEHMTQEHDAHEE